MSAIALSETAVVEIRSLVSQVFGVQRAHRAGITPNYGQLENLFETAGAVDRVLDAQTPAATVRCDVNELHGVATRELPTGRKLCAGCFTTFNLIGAGAGL